MCDEIFDMVRPAEATHITLRDLLRCGVGDTVVRMLVDVRGFMDYDNRESVMHGGGAGGWADEEGEDEEDEVDVADSGAGAARRATLPDAQHDDPLARRFLQRAAPGGEQKAAGAGRRSAESPF